MQKYHGVIHSSDGSYVLASVASSKGAFRITNSLRWPSKNIFGKVMLLNRNVVFGIPAQWNKSNSSNSIEDMTCADSNGSFIPWTFNTELASHVNNLSDNLDSTVPDDIYLATIPYLLEKNIPNSYVTIYEEDSNYRIGVVIDNQLKHSFKMSPISSESLPGHIGRIERFWNQHPDLGTFPTTIYYLSQNNNDISDIADIHQLKYDHLKIKDLEVLKAAGIAIAHTKTDSPVFKLQGQETRKKNKLTWTYAVSLIMVVVAAILFVMSYGLDAFYKNEKNKYESEYQRVIANNKEIQALVELSNTKAEKILRLQKNLSKQTNWGRLLESFGRDKPTDLYIDKLGSEEYKSDPNKIKIALKGWTTEEKNVTEFIGKLQASPYISNIKLNTLQRDQENKRISRYKIECILKLTKE